MYGEKTQEPAMLRHLELRFFLWTFVVFLSSSKVAFPQGANFDDPNMLPNGFPKTQCKLGPNLCYPGGGSSKEEFDRETREKEENNRTKRAEYIKQNTHNRTMIVSRAVTTGSIHRGYQSLTRPAKPPVNSRWPQVA
jgi:hypothetical protein